MRRPLKGHLTQEPGTGGPDHHPSGWLPLTPTGRPHMTAVGAFWLDEQVAPSAGPPPWYVYEMTLENVYAVATKEPGGATRWSF